jgi:hypothetical protein
MSIFDDDGEQYQINDDGEHDQIAELLQLERDSMAKMKTNVRAARKEAQQAYKQLAEGEKHI